MIFSRTLPLWCALLCTLFSSSVNLQAEPVVSEIFYHENHGIAAENPLTEWIELHNRTAAAIDLSGWQMTSGVSFTFPAASSIPAGGYVVIVADLATFNAAHPTVTGAFGPWVGKLSNSGEKITLKNAAGVTADSVTYADSGDWAMRVRGVLDLGHEGWAWEAMHDGGGMSLELVNPVLGNSEGQNWASSSVAGGTPGAANSVASADIAPMILDFKHRPKIPRSTDAVKVTVTLSDELLTGLGATLFWRLDGAATFTSAAMSDLGSGEFSTTIPAQANGVIVEMYVSATDGTNARAWPAAANQEANVLYQVDDSYNPAVAWSATNASLYRVIMTEAERLELQDIGDGSNQPASEDESDAEMNCTFIAEDGTGVAVHYLTSIRNRGATSRSPPPNNQLVKFRSDDPWDGRESVKFNAKVTHSQIIGSFIYRLLGVETADAVASRLRVNGADLASSGAPMWGHYARLESLNGEYTKNHFPTDSKGNLYQIRDNDDNGQEGDLRYEGTDPDNYRDTYFKQTNTSEDDFSDLIALTDALNNSALVSDLSIVASVVDVDQWIRVFAIDTLSGNNEGGLITGKGDDYVIYSGVTDPRFKLLPHDLDTVFDLSYASSVNRTVYSFDGVSGLEKLFDNAVFIQRYQAELLRLVEGEFNNGVLNPIIDENIAYASNSVKNVAKAWIGNRAASVLTQIPRTFSAQSNLTASVEGYGRTTTGAATFSGSFQSAKCLSVRVNGVEAVRNQRAGTWQLVLGAGDNFFKPGLNRVHVKAWSGVNGSGELVSEATLNIWNDTGVMTAVSGTLTGSAPVGTVSMVTRDSYLSANPVLVRVELKNTDGSYNTDVWNQTATLSPSVSGVILSPSTIDVRNGVGSALVTIGGGSGGATSNLINTGAVWSYKDDGSDQGTAWRVPGFDDSGWSSGPAELGYGDGDEATVVEDNPTPGYQSNSTNRYITTYFRREFTVADAGQVAALELKVKRDDGVVVYMNGTEVARNNVGVNQTYLTESPNGSAQENIFLSFTVSPGLLVTGVNTMAVEIHQDNASSSDISFDMELIATAPGTNPGNVTLTASVGGQSVSKALTSLDGVAQTTVSGTLAGASSTWSGVVHVTDDVTIPNGHVLTILPGTLILVDGDATSQSTVGKDIIVQGEISCIGTVASPITFTAAVTNSIWGQILFDNADAANFAYTNISRAGHSPRGGHTGHGRVLRIMGSTVVFDHCNVTDNRGKIGETAAQSGLDSDMTFRHCHWARSVMGIETFDTQVLMEDSYITDMLGQYREDGVTDDNDAIYLHDAGAGQTLTLRRLVLANCEDDGIDTLGAENVVVEDVISRGVTDKGMSMQGGSATITRMLSTGNDIGFSAKAAASVVMDSCSVVNNTTLGIQAENKTGSNAPSFYTVTNSIIWGNGDDVYSDYMPSGITIAYSIAGEVWPGTENLNTDPLFVGAAGGNFHLTAASPARSAGAPPTGDDIGVYPYDPIFDGGGAGAEVRWTAAGGPYRVTADVTIPSGVTFVIEPGTSIYYNPGRRIEVKGTAQIIGSPEMRIQMSQVPGSALVADPASAGLPNSSPKWDGFKIVDSMDPDNRIAYVDVHNAQDTEGAIGIIRSQCVVDNVTFSGTHIRMFYTDTSSVILENSTFPDMFGPTEQAAALGLDNVSEHVKGVGNTPTGGRYIIRNNVFGTNKGHNDVVDVESARRPAPILQVIGNLFLGSRDEELDLGGDVSIEGNFFHSVVKDDQTSDRGYANGISTGDGGTGTTISVARNVFWDVDHAINLKRDTATIFEHNTVYKVHPDFIDSFNNPNIGSVINFYVPGDSGPTAGDGAYAAGNILVDLPRLFGNADLDSTNTLVTPLEANHNLIDPNMTDALLGPNHGTQTVYDLSPTNVMGLPRFVDAANGDFRLLPGSRALGAGSLGQDLGALISAGIIIAGEPLALTASSSATLRVGAPGIFGYRYRVNGGAWSADLDIGDAADPFNPPAATVREAQIVLSGLADGTYTVEVEGQNFGGDWQTTPTVSKTWTVDSALMRVVINEVLADSGDGSADKIEFYNVGANGVDLAGMSVATSLAGARISLPSLPIAAGGYAVIDGAALGFALDNDGEGVYFFDGTGTLIDSVDFGNQIAGMSIGRIGQAGEWMLNTLTLGAANVAAATGNSAALLINEWLAAGDFRFKEDWFELRNLDPLPVPLAGLHLTDQPVANPTLFTFPALSYIAGDGYLRMIADGNPAAGGNHVPFNLDSDDDRLAILDVSGNIIDQVIFGAQTADVSQGRWDAAATGVDFFELPTLGGANEMAGSSAGYDNALALLRYFRITEIMYEPSGGSDYEFLEFKNLGAAALDLTGVAITDGVGFVFPAMTLAAGEEVLVVSNLAAFQTRYGMALNVAGQYSGKLNNAGEWLAVDLAAPYTAHILCFEYKNTWYPGTSGQGLSLTLSSETALAKDWDESESWMASAAAGGSPDGGSILVPSGYVAWLAFYGITSPDDSDSDGLNSLIEFGLGRDPMSLAGTNGVIALPTASESGDGKIQISFELPVNALATDAYGAGEITYVVEAGDELGGWLPIATKSDSTSFAGVGTVSVGAANNGFVPVTVTDTEVIATHGRRFLRLRVTFTP